MTRPSPATHTELDQLLTGLVERVADVNQAVVLSEDGLVVSKSTGFLRDDAERLAATASGLMSLSKGVSMDFRGGPVRQALIEMARGAPRPVKACGPMRSVPALPRNTDHVPPTHWTAYRPVGIMCRVLFTCPRESR